MATLLAVSTLIATPAAATASPAPKPTPATAMDFAITASGDTTGYHLYLSSSSSWQPGTPAWRPLATIQPGGAQDERWIGQQCVTGDGHTVVAVLAPWSADNSETGMDTGALAYAVDVSTGHVRALATGVSLAYFDPGCGADGQVALTSYLGTNQRPTRVTVLDTASGTVRRAATVTDELTSAIAVGTRTIAARGGDLVELTAGRVTVLARMPGQLTDLRAAADGGVDVVSRTTSISSAAWHWTAAKGTSLIASGPIGALRLFGGADGHNLLAGATDVSANAAITLLPAPRSSTAAPVGASRLGSLLLYGAEGALPDKQTPAKVGTMLSDTGRIAFGALPAAAATRFDQKPAYSAATGAVRAAATPSAVTAVPACAVPRNDVYKQVWQPTADQVRWAVNQAALNALNSSYADAARPRDNYMYTVDDSGYSPAPTVYPSALFGLTNLVQGTSPAVTVPPLVMYGIMAQESNWSQASWHAVPGRSGNPLIGNYYGTTSSSPDAVDYSQADCGYGITQLTGAMGQTGYPNSVAAPASWQLAIGVDYATDIAAGEEELQFTWQVLKGMGIVMNNGDPTKIENWYAAIWAYNSGAHTGPAPNGLGWFNNPANPIYPYDRHAFLHNGRTSTPGDAATPQLWPYQEKVFGWMEVPLAASGVLDYRGTYDWDTGAGSFLITPPFATFCSISTNNCRPGQIGNSGGACPANDSSCWWNQPVNWVADSCASSCITDTITHAPNGHTYYTTPGYPEPAAAPLSATCTLGANSGVTDAKGNLLPGTVLVTDTMLADQNPRRLTPNLMGCGANDQALIPPASAVASFALQDANGNPVDAAATPGSAAAIDLHQLGGGIGGHLFFTHTEPSTDTSAQVDGTWSATLPAASGYGTVYEIKAFVPDVAAATGHATYQIDTGQTEGFHGRTLARTVNQSDYSNQWVSLGYYLCGGPTDGSSCTMRVTLGNLTPSDDGSQGADIAYNAIAFVPVPTGGYVALGDSYSSGEGVYTGFDDGTDVGHNLDADSGNLCHRSSQSWPRLLAAAKSIPVVELACSGSNLSDLTGISYFLDQTTQPAYPLVPQSMLYKLDILNDGSLAAATPPNPAKTDNWIPDNPNQEGAGSAYYSEPAYQTELLRALRPKLVTLTIGGNDLGFADILETCVAVSPCQSSFTTSSGTDEIDRRIASLQPYLQAAYTAVRQAAGTANVYVLSYPSPIAYQAGQPANATDCSLIVNSDRQWLTGKVGELAGVIKTAAGKAGIKYLDISGVFNGHDICAANPYADQISVNTSTGLTASWIDNFYHPDAAGYQAIEQAIAAQISTS